MKRIYDSHGNSITPGRKLAQGGEALVYRVKEYPGLLAKIYAAPREAYVRKLAWMVANPPTAPEQINGHAALAWPTDLLFVQGGRFVGYLMPYVRQTALLLEVFNPRQRAQKFQDFPGRYLYRTAHNLAATLDRLHARGYVVGDLNESNVLVTPSALVTLIDADSFQVQGDGQVFFCPVGKLEYTPPELQGKDLQETLQTPEHDNFGLAVLVFQLLMAGSHPFRSRWLGAGDAPPLAEKIRQGLYPYSTITPTLVVPPPRASLEHLPPEVGQLFQRCFVTGHAHPEQRPTAQEWAQTLASAEQSLVQCAEGHDYASHLPECPECVTAARRTPGKPALAAPPESMPPQPASAHTRPPVSLARSFHRKNIRKAASLKHGRQSWRWRLTLGRTQVMRLIGAPPVLALLFGSGGDALTALILALVLSIMPGFAWLTRAVWVRTYAPARRFRREQAMTQGQIMYRRCNGSRVRYRLFYRFTAPDAAGKELTVYQSQMVSRRIYAGLPAGTPVTVRYAPYAPELALLDIAQTKLVVWPRFSPQQPDLRWEELLPTWQQRLVTADAPAMRFVAAVLIFILVAAIFPLTGAVPIYLPTALVPAEILAMLMSILFEMVLFGAFLGFFPALLTHNWPGVHHVQRRIWELVYPPARRFRQRSVTTQGRLLERHGLYSNDRHWVKYQFAAYDQEQTLQEGILAAHLLRKDLRQLNASRPVTVRYDPQNPALARIEIKMRWEESVGMVMFFTLVLLIGLLGVVLSSQTCIPECIAQPQPVYDVQPLVAGSVPVPTATVPDMPEMIPTYRVPGGFYAGGDPAAPVTVMQFSDFQCESCARFILGETYSRFIADYVDTGKVYYIFHDFPLNQHANAGKAAEAARCAGEQGGYWPMYTLLFMRQSDWRSGPPEPVFTEFATQMGLARAPFAACLASRRYAGDIVNAYQLARNAGICSAPTFLVNGYRVGEANGLLEAIDTALAEEQFTVPERAEQ